MSQREGRCVPIVNRLRSFAVDEYKALQLSIERRSFERKLESIVRAALAHQSGGLSAGNRQYKLLTTQANSICVDFTSRWNIDPNLLDAQIPAIAKLKALADPAPKPEPVVLVSLGVAAAVAFFFLMGVLAGLTSVGYPRQSITTKSPTAIADSTALTSASPYFCLGNVCPGTDPLGLVDQTLIRVRRQYYDCRFGHFCRDFAS